MPFSIRPYRRFPVCCPVTYQRGLFEGHGTVWNLSPTGWRFSGNLALRVGEVCSLTANLPTVETIYVAAGIVRWLTFHNSAQHALWLARQRKRVDKVEADVFRNIRRADHEACLRTGKDNC
jgi:hypothetical protein